MNIFEEKKKMISGYKKKSHELLVQFKEDEKRLKLLEGKAYREWLKNLSLAEGALKEKIYELNETLFADLTFEGSIRRGCEQPWRLYYATARHRPITQHQLHYQH